MSRVSNLPRHAVSLLLTAAAFLFAGCAALDPEGDWRGTPVARSATDNNAGPRSMLARIEQEYAAGQHAKARSLVDELLQRHPREPAAWFRRANLYHHSGMLDEAVIAYKRAIELEQRGSGSLAAGSDELRSRATANLALLSIEQLRRSLENLDSQARDSAGSPHRARVEQALKLMAAQGLTAAQGDTGKLPPGRPADSAKGSTHSPQRAQAALPGPAPGTRDAGLAATNSATSAEPAQGPVEIIRGLPGR